MSAHGCCVGVVTNEYLCDRNCESLDFEFLDSANQPSIFYQLINFDYPFTGPVG